MKVCRPYLIAFASALVGVITLTGSVRADDVPGTIKSVDPESNEIILKPDAGHGDVSVKLTEDTAIANDKGEASPLSALKPGARITVTDEVLASKVSVQPEPGPRTMLQEFWHNFSHNLFKPLLLFFYMGFLVPILKVKFEFPYVIYQGLTIYLLIAIGWHGGEQLAVLDFETLVRAGGFMVVGFALNFAIGILAYLGLKTFTNLRRIDKATVAGYYGSDSAGTFVTCLGVLTTVHIAYDAYMPVMLAVMEIPGCLVALYLVARLRHNGMDPAGNMPDEPGYNPKAAPPPSLAGEVHGHDGHARALEDEAELSLEKMAHSGQGGNGGRPGGLLSPQLLHEVFLNPGLYLLFGGLAVGFISGRQGPSVTRADDSFFVDLFQGILCLFLLEMGMTASRKLKDLHSAGLSFVLFGLLAPNVFATIGILTAHAYGWATGTHFLLGSYVLFAVLCGAASYIAVPAVQRLAIPEASPTLPLAASLGLTFSYNVTIGIPVYIEITKAVLKTWPI